MAGKMKTAPLDAAVADKLLDLLGQSDDFRALFAANPSAALQQVGYQATTQKSSLVAEATAPSIAGCIGVQQLASKEDILASRDALRSMLLSGLSQISPQLDATYKAE